MIDAEHDAVHEAAAEWFTRLMGHEVSVEETAQWQHWMAADEAHAQAFRRIEETWQRFDAAAKPALTPATAMKADRYDGSMAVGDYFSRRQLPRRTWALAASLAVATLGSVAVWFYAQDWDLRGANTRVVETGLGENRTVRLTDGSRVTLGGRTRVEITFDAQSRRLQLKRGEASFTVAKDPGRPFSVRTETATVTAVGTEFNVRRGDDRVVVAVVEGRVLVEPAIPALQQLPMLRDLTPRAPRRTPRQLEAGDRTVVDASGIESSTELADPKAAVAWQTGRLAFEREPLKYVLEDVNRYARKPVVLADKSIGELKITGTVINGNVAGWVSSLETAFGLRASEDETRILLGRH